MAEPRFNPIFPGDWADADRAYHNYVENCHRLGIQPHAACWVLPDNEGGKPCPAPPPAGDLWSVRVPTAGNLLIAALPSKDRTGLLATCEEVELRFEETLIEPGGRIHHVYFPTDGCYISLLTPVDGATSLEVGLVGREGMCGVSVVLGTDISPLQALVQGSGPALRLSVAGFKRELRNSPALQQALNRYLYFLMTHLAQSAACTRFHLIEARMARWLLMTQDRARSNKFRITHAFLAWMLGVRRAGVSQAANALRSRGLIA